MMPPSEIPWWKEATFYQIWPNSYIDSNGDGIGDIPGIISKLDYLEGLGVDAIWLCPIYDSPQVDMGYDVRDYQAVWSPYGTVADVDALIEGCHARGMRLVLDLVANHTSDQHAWFQESRSSKSNPKRDWYLWRRPRYIDGKRHPPNNWRAVSGGSIWEWDELTQEYYFHLYAPEQPDLNWDCDAVRKEIYGSVMQFWLDRGIDGFRIDTVNLYSKDTTFPDAEISDWDSEYQPAQKYYVNGPRMHEFVREMTTQVFDKYQGTIKIGEISHSFDVDQAGRYVSDRELDMVFLFHVVALGKHRRKRFTTVPFSLREFKDAIATVQQSAWPTVFFENHDQPRSLPRIGSADNKYRFESGKMLALLLATLSGTLFLYQGQEIGMVNCPVHWPIDEYRDKLSLNFYREVETSTKGNPTALLEAFRGIQALARDNARTPMQWDDSPHAGFTTGENVKPWMRVNDEYPKVNVKAQQVEENSILSFYKRLLRLRKRYRGLFVHGSFEVLDWDNENVFLFLKQAAGSVSLDNNRDLVSKEKQLDADAHDAQRAVVVLNFSVSEQPCDVGSLVSQGVQEGGGDLLELELLISTAVSDGHSKDDSLAPYEGRVYIQRTNNKN
jgi:oligo-1,6-glucosidase